MMLSRLVMTVAAPTVDSSRSLVSKMTTGLAARPDMPSTTTIMWPAMMRSPLFSVVLAVRGWPLRVVPFLLPRSTAVHASPSRSNSVCWRDRPESLGKLSSAVAERPRQSRSPASGTIWLFPSGERIWSSFIRSVSVLWQGSARAASGRSQDRGQFRYGNCALLTGHVAVSQRPHHPVIEAVHPDAAFLQTRADFL